MVTGSSYLQNKLEDDCFICLIYNNSVSHVYEVRLGSSISEFKTLNSYTIINNSSYQHIPYLLKWTLQANIFVKNME